MNQDNKKAVAVGVTGAVVGAGVAAAATAMLADKKTREKIMHTASELKDYVIESVQDHNPVETVKTLKKNVDKKTILGKK